jgi:hypothetical protein
MGRLFGGGAELSTQGARMWSGVPMKMKIETEKS